MEITIFGKTISITEKNVRAYKKLNTLPLDKTAVMIYIDAWFHKDIEETVRLHSNKELSDIVNTGIEKEVRSCGGEKFYEEA